MYMYICIYLHMYIHIHVLSYICFVSFKACDFEVCLFIVFSDSKSMSSCSSSLVRVTIVLILLLFVAGPRILAFYLIDRPLSRAPRKA